MTSACGTTDATREETNWGVTTTKQKCFVPDVGEHWFSENYIINILCLSDVADKCRVTLDTDDEKAFKVYFPRKTVKFKQLSNRLCGLMHSDSTRHREHPIEPNKGLNFVNDNLKCFSEAMKKRSSKARKYAQRQAHQTSLPSRQQCS